MNRLTKSVLAAALLGFGTANASDVLVTPSSNGKQTVITFELSNTSEAVGLQFNIALEGVSEKLIDISGCNNASKGLVACHFSKGVLGFAAMDTSLKPLATSQLGSVTINAPISEIGSLQPQAIIVSDAKGTEIPGTLLLDLQFVESQLSAKQMGDFAVK